MPIDVPKVTLPSSAPVQEVYFSSPTPTKTLSSPVLSRHDRTVFVCVGGNDRRRVMIIIILTTAIGA
jgi:hypothetical protein